MKAKQNNDIKRPLIEKTSIEKLVPHRFPILLIDTLENYTENTAVTTLKIEENSIFVVDGFFSEAGILENMEQTAAIHTGYTHDQAKGNVREGYIASIRNVAIRTLPAVGETIYTQVEILYRTQDISQVKFSTLLKNKVIATAHMNTILKS